MLNLNTLDVKIIEFIIENTQCKQSAITREFNIDKGNLSRRCKAYKQLGLLKEGVLLEINPTFNTYLILEIKHFEVLSFFTDIFGNKVSKVTSHSYTDNNSLYAVIQQILEGSNHTSFDAIGCVVHGKLQNGIISHVATTPIYDFPITSYLSTLTDKNIYVENFANVAALSNYLLSGEKTHSLFYLRTSPALGAGLIYNAEIFHGFSGTAMEPGWMLLSYSSNEFYNDFFMSLEENFESDSKPKDSQIINYIEHLNQIVSNVSSILDPEIFIIESSVLKLHPLLLHSLNHKEISLSSVPLEECYKSICKLIFRGQTQVNYTTFLY